MTQGVNATTEEIQLAIEGLSDDDLYRIELAGRSFHPGSEFACAADLMNEAVLRAMSAAAGGKGRPWPKNEAFIAFLIMVMRGIANDSRDSAAVTKTTSIEALSANVGSGSHPLDSLEHKTDDHETRLIEWEESEELSSKAAAEAKAIEDHFAEDEDVSMLIMWLKEERNTTKAREMAEMSPTRYETVRKRMRRGVKKIFPHRSKP